MKKNKTMFLVLFLILSLALFAGCSAGQEEQEDGKTVITIVYTDPLDNLKALVEDRLPDVELQYEYLISYTPDADIQRQVEAGYGPDLLISRQPQNEESAMNVIPLDGYEFSGRYESTMLSGLLLEERLYYLPLPGQYNGYVINKTLFDQQGIPLPATNEELIAAMAALRDAGCGLTDTGHVFGFNEFDNITLGTWVTGCMVPDFLGTADGARWMEGYIARETVMSGTWEGAFSFYEQLVENGLINTMPFSRQSNAPDNDNYMGQGRLAAAYGNSAFLEEVRQLNAREAEAGTSPAYEYAMLPFLGGEDAANWTVVLPAGYIGINAGLQEEGKEEKLEACLQILDLISTQEGQEALMADMRLDNSYLKEFDRESHVVPEGLEETVESGNVYYVRLPGKSLTYLGAQSRQVLGGGKTVEECFAAVDEYHLHGSEAVDADLSPVGASAQDLIYQNYNTRRGETALGNLVADSIAAYSGAPIAVANGGGVRASIYQGAVLKEDLLAVCPYDNQIVVVRMTGAVLLEMLENGLGTWVPAEEFPGGRFLQVSGITYTFDASLPAGERLVSAQLEDGTPIEASEWYEVAVNNYMAGVNGYLDGNGDGFTMLNLYSEDTPPAEGVELVKEDLGTYRDALEYYFARHDGEPVVAETEGRITNLAEDREEGE
ncbi:MAG: extracellular solute-binding protein [Bacillota bacterium]|nr:extracellular solute-binding protein [Bacillota bacterium]